ncbi:unnamed protein product [Dibothriocephalus latus]|uniref:Uncharacterized protein n=1 Tax=Dibothriocephalus latus TaxID=60516 RepID=A0A3P7LJ42_DIBLA|nr:unnamed protein product [Dibothriocephalus latus]
MIVFSAGAMTPDLRTKVVSAGLQNICDLILVVYNKNDFKKEDRQYAYNQASAISEMLRWFNLDPPPFTYELHKHTDLEDRYTVGTFSLFTFLAYQPL